MVNLWDKYNDIRITGDKKTANKILTEFISSIKLEDYSFRKDFIDNICETFLENKIAYNNGTEVSAKKFEYNIRCSKK